MKETPIFEEVFLRLVRQPGFLARFVVGGLLSFVPVINFFAFGFLYRVALRIRRGKRAPLPDWDDWGGLFRDGLRFAVPWLTYFLLPVGLAFLVSIPLGMIGFSFVSILLSAGVLLLAPLFFCSALYRLQTRGQFEDLLDVVLIFKMTWAKMPNFIIPALVFLGLFAFRFPLYGFVDFFGFLMLVVYTTLCFQRIEHPGVTRVQF